MTISTSRLRLGLVLLVTGVPCEGMAQSIPSKNDAMSQLDLCIYRNAREIDDGKADVRLISRAIFNSCKQNVALVVEAYIPPPKALTLEEEVEERRSNIEAREAIERGIREFVEVTVLKNRARLNK